MLTQAMVLFVIMVPAPKLPDSDVVGSWELQFGGPKRVLVELHHNGKVKFHSDYKGQCWTRREGFSVVSVWFAAAEGGNRFVVEFNPKTGIGIASSLVEGRVIWDVTVSLKRLELLPMPR